MALRRSSSGRMHRNNEDIDEEEAENNGYIQVFVKPLESGGYSMILGWLGVGSVKLTGQQVRMVYIGAGLLGTVLLYQILFSDLGYFFHRVCSLIIPIFSVASAFYCIALYLRKTWSNTSVYIMFCACFAGEFLGQCFVGDSGYITRPMLCLTVLVAVSVASVFSSLETVHSTGIILFVSLVRIIACTTFVELPEMLRPFVAYFSGVAGVIAARYMEVVLRAPGVVSGLGSETPSGIIPAQPPGAGGVALTPEGKIPVIKRRRSSASTAGPPGAGSFSRQHSRRTSLPALIHSKQVRTLFFAWTAHSRNLPWLGHNVKCVLPSDTFHFPVCDTQKAHS